MRIVSVMNDLQSTLPSCIILMGAGMGHGMVPRKSISSNTCFFMSTTAARPDARR